MFRLAVRQEYKFPNAEAKEIPLILDFPKRRLALFLVGAANSFHLTKATEKIQNRVREVGD